jgi:hypothetical protein
VGPDGVNAATGEDTAEMLGQALPVLLFERIAAKFGTADVATISLWQHECKKTNEDTPANQFRREAKYHQLLLRAGNEYTMRQRFDNYVASNTHNPGVGTAIQDFYRVNPTLASRTYTALKTHILTQAPNIEASMVRADVFPNPSAAAATGAAMAASADKVFSQSDMEKIVAAVMLKVANTGQGQQEPPLYYCFAHGTNETHDGSGCPNIQQGRPMIGTWHDTRSPDPTRKFGHSSCTHQPPCISVADANRAVSADQFPNTPGNANFFRKSTQGPRGPSKRGHRK